MSLGEKPAMNICIERAKVWFENHPKAKQWMWFVALWCGGLGTVLAVSYPIKWLIKSMG